MPEPRRPLAPFDDKHDPRAGPAGRPLALPLGGLSGAAAVLFAGAAALVLGAGLLAGWSIPRDGSGARTDRCAVPPGIDLHALGAAQRDRVAERAMLCADLEHGRLSIREYHARLDGLERRRAEPLAPLPETVWASSLREFSSQYSADSWSASQVLGPPDALPGGQDSPNAWASMGADTGAEFLEVAFAGQHRMNGIDILESFNPGAVARVELLLADGTRTVVHSSPAAPAEPTTLRRRIDFACTDQPVAGVRVTIDSHLVPGWNEIDAIGGRPCRD